MIAMLEASKPRKTKAVGLRSHDTHAGRADRLDPMPAGRRSSALPADHADRQDIPAQKKRPTNKRRALTTVVPNSPAARRFDQPSRADAGHSSAALQWRTAASAREVDSTERKKLRTNKAAGHDTVGIPGPNARRLAKPSRVAAGRSIRAGRVPVAGAARGAELSDEAGVGLPRGDTPFTGADPALIGGIRTNHRLRAASMRMQSAVDNAAGAMGRQLFGFVPGAKDAADVKARVAAVIAAIERGIPILPDLAEQQAALGWKRSMAAEKRRKIEARAALLATAAELHAGEIDVLRVFALASLESRKSYDAMRKTCEKAMAEAAGKLPVAGYIEQTHGLGAVGVAMIVGEAGDLAGYANPAKLWKRMGLAVFGGQRQRKTRDAEAAIEQGYNPRRRCVAWLVGDALLKNNKGVYRRIYDQRKAYELARTDENKPRSPKHAHLRAKRIVEKDLLVNLWRIWRGLPERPFAQTGKAAKPVRATKAPKRKAVATL